MSPTFNFSTGNPNNLVGGASASMVDIQGSLTDLRSFINGSIDQTNAPTFESAFSTYKTIEWGGAELLAPTNNTWIVGSQATAALGNQQLGAAGATTTAAFWFDPTNFTAGSRVVKLNLRFKVVTNAVVPGQTMAMGMYPVTGIGGASGAAPFINAVGTLVTGSGASIVAGGFAVSAVQQVLSGDFTAPAAGHYCLAVTLSGAAAAGSYQSINGQLYMRQT